MIFPNFAKLFYYGYFFYLKEEGQKGHLSFANELEAFSRGQLVTALNKLIAQHPELESVFHF